MAKQKMPRGSRSQAIRDYLQQHPGASVHEIMEGLKKSGIEVGKGLVSNVKYTRRATSQGGPGRQGRQGSSSRAGRTGSSGGELTANDLIEAKKVVDQIGSIEAARRALAALEQLQ